MARYTAVGAYRLLVLGSWVVMSSRGRCKQDRSATTWGSNLATTIQSKNMLSLAPCPDMKLIYSRRRSVYIIVESEISTCYRACRTGSCEEKVFNVLVYDAITHFVHSVCWVFSCCLVIHVYIAPYILHGCFPALLPPLSRSCSFITMPDHLWKS